MTCDERSHAEDIVYQTKRLCQWRKNSNAEEANEKDYQGMRWKNDIW